MFFEVSKLVWALTMPAHVLLLLIVIGAVLLWTPWRRGGRLLITLVALGSVFIAVVPVGTWMIAYLEDRFPAVAIASLPPKVDGIISLAGGINQFVAQARKQVSTGGSIARISEFVMLANRYPEAKLVFAGGSGDLFRQDVSEADIVAEYVKLLGLDPSRILFEKRSRNTYENAVAARQFVNPKPGEKWVLVTSARHMPRAVGCFRKAGWAVIPYPVGFVTESTGIFSLSFNFIGGLGHLQYAVYEMAGLLAYWLTGRTDRLFPSALDELVSTAGT
ncbi:MAG: YdcF family protein [Rhodospirillales bacterium]|nr:YdcF family protein [Rhodospirillales bacterium]